MADGGRRSRVGSGTVELWDCYVDLRVGGRDETRREEEEEEGAGRGSCRAHSRRRLATMPILRLDNLTTLLQDLVCDEGMPHTSLLVSRAGAVIASHSTPSSEPFPAPSLAERGDEERARTYAAVASTTWEEERPAGKGTDAEPLMLETEVSPHYLALLPRSPRRVARADGGGRTWCIPSHPRRVRGLAVESHGHQGEHLISSALGRP